MYSFYCFSEIEKMTNCTKGPGTHVCLYFNMYINGNLNNLNMSGYHSTTLRLLSSALKKKKSLTIFTDWQGHLFSCPGQLQRKKTNECQMEKVPDHFATSSQNPSQPFGGMYEIKFVSPGRRFPLKLQTFCFQQLWYSFQTVNFYLAITVKLLEKKLAPYIFLNNISV